MITPVPEQRAVIDHPLEPLRVAAGAGTGKTSTMAWRLQALVERHDIAPEQALGITFTNKAAEELASRLRDALPAAAREGREVEVTTYHGFAHSLVRELGPLIGLPRSIEVVTPGYVRQLLREALGAEPREHLNLTHPPTSVARLATLANALGDNLLEPAQVIDAAGSEDPWPVRLEMARVLEVFEAEKRRLGVVDYADLVSLAHRILSEHPEAAARVRSRYRAVLLDEYQDTNPAQRELLRLLFGDGFPITAVGDSDQTIYEWRGASLENFEGFPEHFPLADGTPSHTLHLSKNRRSGRTIVSVAEAIRTLLERKGPLPELAPMPSAAAGEVMTAWFHAAPDEARWIAAELQRRHEEGTPWSEMAILFRKHRQIGVVRDALERAGIPAEVVSLGGLLEVPVVSDLHSWLRILGRPDDGPALMRVLLRGPLRLGMGDIAPLSAWARARRHDDRLDDAGIGWGLLEAIDHLDEVDGVSAEASRRLGGFRSSYRRLLESAQASDLGELTRLVLDETGMWPEVDALPDSASLSARLNLYRFLDLTETWSPLEGRPSLPGFLDHLDLLADENAVDELDVARVSEEDAVALLTVHRAKGLEWDVVFLPGLVEGTFPSRNVEVADHTRRPHVLPPELRLDSSPVEDPDAAARTAHDDQEIRTAYVAVTRARQALAASGAWWYTEKQPRDPGPIFEAIDAHATERIDGPSEPGDPPAALGIDLDDAPDPDPHFAGTWREMLRTAVSSPGAGREVAAGHGLGPAYDHHMDQLSLVLDGLPEPLAVSEPDEPFRTSVTGLVTFAQCPLRFHWSEVDRLPRRPTIALRRGVELHRRIELFNRGSLAFEDADEDFYDAVGSGEGTGGVAAAFDHFRESRFADERPELVEAPFDLKLGDARIAGRIDAAYRPDRRTLEVVDFKSGRKRDDPSQRVQIEAYGLAVNEPGVFDPPPERTLVTFAYFGDGAEEVSEEVDDAWLDEARTHLEGLIERAGSGERTATPSEACRFCDFSHVCDPGQAWLEANT